MTNFVFTNAAVAYLANSLAPAVGTIVLSSGDGARFPSPTGGKRATLVAENRLTGQREIMWLTSRTGDQLTVLRGQEGTTAISWAAGTLLSHRVTAAVYNDDAARLIAAEADINAAQAAIISAQAAITALQAGAAGIRSIATGGTGAGTVNDMQTNFGLRPGVDIQTHTLATTALAALAANQPQGVIPTTTGGSTYSYTEIVGMVIPFARPTLPFGWVECNGAALSRATYARLFGIIGTAFGAGNGTTTFNVPDLRGEFIRGWDNGRGVDASRAFGSFQDFAIENIQGEFAYRTQSIVDGALFQNGGPAWGSRGNVGDNTEDPLSVLFDASNVAQTSDETRPRNVALTMAIKW